MSIMANGKATARWSNKNPVFFFNGRFFDDYMTSGTALERRSNVTMASNVYSPTPE